MMRNNKSIMRKKIVIVNQNFLGFKSYSIREKGNHFI